MNADEIRIALESAEGIPEPALRAAVEEAASLAPAVIAVAQRMAGGYLPLPREERLLRFGLHALAAARETSACPAFLALLKRPALEMEWMFGEGRVSTVARLLLGLFDGDDAAVCAVAADPAVDSEVRSALLSALARLVWEGRASRDRLLELLDRFDREELAAPESWAWMGWQDAIMLLGLTDWIERVRRGWDAGRVPMFERDVDRRDWLERTHAAAANPDDPQRFVVDSLVPIDDPVASVGWSADPASGPGEAPTGDELAWLEVVLWRMVATGTMCLEEADGFLTALAAGPVRVPPAEFLPEIWGAAAEEPLFDTPEHDALASDLLARHHAALEAALERPELIVPWINHDVGEPEAALWARGFMRGVGLRQAAWEPLVRRKRVAERVLLPILALIPEMAGEGGAKLSFEDRRIAILALPAVAAAVHLFWQDGESALFDSAEPARVRKVGRNEPCPCGSGKKYKKCCGAAA